VWCEHLRNPALLASFAIGFLILFAFIGTFTYVNFVLVRPPILLSAMSLGLVYFVFVPSIVSTPFAGYFVKRMGTAGAFLERFTGRARRAASAAVGKSRRHSGRAAIGWGRNIFCAGRRDRLRWSHGIDRPCGSKWNLSCLLLLRRRRRQRTPRPGIRALRMDRLRCRDRCSSDAVHCFRIGNENTQRDFFACHGRHSCRVRGIRSAFCRFVRGRG